MRYQAAPRPDRGTRMLPEVIRYSQALIVGDIKPAVIRRYVREAIALVSQRPTDIQIISGPDID